MQDEVLAKALITDVEAVPRYTIIDQNGNTIAQNATIILQNTVLQEGTPINTNTLLTPATAQAIGDAKGVEPPETVNEALSLLMAAGVKYYTGTINTSVWSPVTGATYKYSGTVTVTGADFGTMTTALVAISPTADVITEWLNNGVMALTHGGTNITFASNKLPENALTFIAAVLPMTEA